MHIHIEKNDVAHISVKQSNHTKETVLTQESSLCEDYSLQQESSSLNEGFSPQEEHSSTSHAIN